MELITQYMEKYNLFCTQLLFGKLLLISNIIIQTREAVVQVDVFALYFNYYLAITQYIKKIC